MKRLADFDLDAGSIPAEILAHLMSGACLDAGDPVVMLGDSGTGKRPLLIGLGFAACEQGRRVRYVGNRAAVQRARRAADDRALSRVVGKYGRPDLLLPRRTWLRPHHPPRRGVALPGHHRT
ncbi:MAG: ATP-binding protein [Lapillicoccus sp.]